MSKAKGLTDSYNEMKLKSQTLCDATFTSRLVKDDHSPQI